MDDHIADALSRPDLLRFDDGLACLRFETMKVVSALAAVRHLLDHGAVAPGDTLVDSSSGIYAHALALACHRHGLHCHIVASATVDRTLLTQLAILGATVEPVRAAPAEQGSSLKLDQNRRVARIQEILRDNPRYHWMRQYHDDIHYLGYRSVADLVRKEWGTADLTVVGGVGTGASTGALATYLREHDPDVRLVGVQPFDSVTFASDHVHDPEIIIAGIGSSIPFANVAHELYDVMHWFGFAAAMAGGVSLLREHAVFAGLSSGAAYLAARWERRADPDRRVLFVAPDTGHRYVEAAYARHPEARHPDRLAPREISCPGEMAQPWSRMAWNRSPAPPQAIAVEPARAAS